MNTLIKMVIEISYWIQIAFAVIITITGLYKYNNLNVVSKLAICMIINTTFSDILISSFEKNFLYLNIILQYAFLTDLVLNSLFLHYSMKSDKQIHLAGYLIAFGVVFWLTNLLFFLPFSDTKNNFWYYQSFLSLCFIITGLVVISKRLRDRSLKENFRDPAFRFLLIFMFCSAVVFIFGIVIPIVRREHLYYILLTFTWATSDLSFLAVELTLLAHPKKNATLH